MNQSPQNRVGGKDILIILEPQLLMAESRPHRKLATLAPYRIWRNENSGPQRPFGKQSQISLISKTMKLPFILRGKLCH